MGGWGMVGGAHKDEGTFPKRGQNRTEIEKVLGMNINPNGDKKSIWLSKHKRRVSRLLPRLGTLPASIVPWFGEM